MLEYIIEYYLVTTCDSYFSNSGELLHTHHTLFIPLTLLRILTMFPLLSFLVKHLMPTWIVLHCLPTVYFPWRQGMVLIQLYILPIFLYPMPCDISSVISIFSLYPMLSGNRWHEWGCKWGLWFLKTISNIYMLLFSW